MKNLLKLRARHHRNHRRYSRMRDDETNPFCKEKVLERHPITGLPLLTECKFKNGKTMYIYYKRDGSWVVDRIEVE
jgi:hypothetical protein